MSDTITVAGIVGSEPKHVVTSTGLAVTSFRMASTHRYFDRNADRWESGDTNWYTVTTFRQLAVNAFASLHKGEHVLVTGRLRLRSWETAERSGLSVEIEASGVGHDLSWVTSRAVRALRTTPTDDHDAARRVVELADSDDVGETEWPSPLQNASAAVSA